ncbi:MAG: Y-family DNA polymerase [Prolixibacteraceae bacterium]|nr:Y-family DNA polymerase [Prolixibacteraceae bacterium]
MFALVDCNNFYVSCERVFRPDLNNKPVVVLSNNDGCIISRSEEAKALGLKMAEPVFQRFELVKKAGVFVFSSNYTLYGDLSQRVMETLRGVAPVIEIYSIDEAFLDLSGLDIDFQMWAEEIKKIVWRITGIPISIGIAPTKTLAKIANKAAKKGNGIFIIRNDRHRDCMIRNTAIEKVWGVGRQYSKLLFRNRIFSAYDYTLLDDNWLRSQMKVMGLRIKTELLGESCIPLELIIPSKKAIATTRAFGRKTKSKRLLKEAVSTYAARCGEKLRKQSSLANLITVFIHTDPFNQNDLQYNKSKSITLPVATNCTQVLIKYALKLLDDIFLPGYFYKKAGVIIEGLEPQKLWQPDLFEALNREKYNRLSVVVDGLNNYFGRDTVKVAIQGSGEEWKLRQEKLSNRFTTNWNETLVVKV